MRLLSPFILTLCIIITAVVLLTPAVPLGVTGLNADGSANVEWVWQRHPGFSGVLDAVARLLPALISGSTFLAIGLYGARRISAASRAKTAWLYLALIVVSGIWFNCVQHAAPLSHRDVKSQWVLYDPSASGYFFEAVYRIHSTDEFLAGYEKKMSEGDVLHVGTHPPGLFLLAESCVAACESSPALVSFLKLTAGKRATEAFRYLEREANLARTVLSADQKKRNAKIGTVASSTLTETELAGLQLLSKLSTLAVVLTILPLSCLSHLLLDRVSAWKIACLWGTLPCMAIFAPKSDVLFTLTCTTVLALAVAAIDGRNNASFLFAALAGAVLWMGMMMSLAHLPVVILLCIFVVVRTWHSKWQTVRRDSLIAFVVAATVVLLCLAFNAATGCNMFEVWPLNLKNHSGFYDQFSRTWWKWLLVNPFELAFAIGLPLFIVSLTGVVNSARDAIHRPKCGSRFIATAFCLAASATFDLLWLSGKNQGEAARLWCFLTPWLLYMAGYYFTATSHGNNDKTADSIADFRSLMVAQLIVATLTVACVSGFSF